MGQAEMNTGGLSQQGLSWLRECERAWVCSQMIYGDLSRASTNRARSFIYLVGREVKREKSEIKLNV